MLRKYKNIYDFYKNKLIFYENHLMLNLFFENHFMWVKICCVYKYMLALWNNLYGNLAWSYSISAIVYVIAAAIPKSFIKIKLFLFNLT